MTKQPKPALVDEVPPWSVLSASFDLRTLKPSRPKKTKPKKRTR